MMKKLRKFCVLLVLFLCCVLAFWDGCDGVAPAEVVSIDDREPEAIESSHDGADRADEPGDATLDGGRVLGLRNAQLVEEGDVKKLPRMHGLQYSEFGADGRVVRNSEGRVIWRETEEYPVRYFRASPTAERYMVSAGGVRSYLVSNSGELILELPDVPDGEDRLGLAYWRWLNDHLLLGVSGTRNRDPQGKLYGSHQPDYAALELFVFDVRTKTLHPVRLPSGYRRDNFETGGMGADGEFELRFRGDDAYWFQLKLEGGE